tara:strand:+ start:1889 stop:2068 length:180 start_codon:yes stop_codon:yes gene_type:complete
MTTGRKFDQAWDEAYDLIHEISRRHDFDTSLSLDEFYSEYYYQLTEDEKTQIEEILNKF